MTEHGDTGPIRRDEIQGDIWHEYDGIEEADNQLPLWWLMVFFGSIVFGVGYWFTYHEYGLDELPGDAYALAVKEAEFRAKEREKELAEKAGAGGLAGLAGDPGSVGAGKAVFTTTCVACHGPDAAGNIGPNLTDKYWIHGGSAEDIHKVIDQGIVAKGMPAWGPVLGPVAVQQVTAYVLSLRNTNVAGKAPQGEEWVAPAVEAGAEHAPEASAEHAPETGAEHAPEAGAEHAPEAPPEPGAHATAD